ncbi:MAG: PilW family protein [Deltaproteobacteria bacterium]|nr:PilW family protein [Deltaproteobacteria bacterium]
MGCAKPLFEKRVSKMMQENGVTLVELLVAMTIGLVVMAAIYSTYISQQQQYLVQEQVSGMQQNLRASVYFIARETRMAGYDPTESGNFALTNVTLDGNGDSTITFQADFDDDGTLGADETIAYSIFDSGADGITDLARNDGGGNQLLAQGVESLGLAYAFDEDGDGELDTSGGNVIWAVDTNGDNQLDLNLDTDGDGVINISDDTTPGNGVLEGVTLVALGLPNVPLANIRAVKIWILARTDKVIRGFHDTDSYVVGRRVITPVGDDNKFKRRLLTTTVRCRNLNT